MVTRTSAVFYAASWAEINAVAQKGRASQAWALGREGGDAHHGENHPNPHRGL